MSSENLENLKFLTKYFQESKVLIVDRVRSSRQRLADILKNCGVQNDNISISDSFHSALDLSKKINFDLIFTDYLIVGGNGIDLIREIRDSRLESTRFISILITSNMSQVTVARSAEEEIDAYILKPFLIDSLQKNILSALAFKLNPPDYLQKIEEGKKLYNQQDYADALILFENAKFLNSSSASVFYYLGVTQRKIGFTLRSIELHKKGYQLNKLHFKNLMGLFDSLKDAERDSDAYEVLKNILKYFPFNSKRLQEIIRLAIKTKNYNDIEIYYKLLLTYDHYDETTSRAVSAGMYILGKFKLLQNDFNGAYAVFDKIGTISFGDIKIIRSIIELLYDKKLISESKRYLAFLPEEQSDSLDYRICYFISSSFEMGEADCLNEAYKFYQEGDRSIPILKIISDLLPKLQVNLPVDLDQINLDAKRIHKISLL